MEILAKLHDNPIIGYFVEERTHELVSRRFY
jgi:hypothetical protein